MSTKPATASQKNTSKKIRVVNFDPVAFKAPIVLRLGAITIDYLLIGIFPVLGLLSARLFGEDGSQLLNSDLNNVAWLIAAIVGISDLLILPLASGQSIGKAVMGISIVNKNGERASTGSIVIRQIFGYLLCILTGGLGFLIALFNAKGRAIQDLVGGTVVVHAKSVERTGI